MSRLTCLKLGIATLSGLACVVGAAIAGEQKSTLRPPRPDASVPGISEEAAAQGEVVYELLDFVEDDATGPIYFLSSTPRSEEFVAKVRASQRPSYVTLAPRQGRSDLPTAESSSSTEPDSSQQTHEVLDVVVNEQGGVVYFLSSDPEDEKSGVAIARRPSFVAIYPNRVGPPLTSETQEQMEQTSSATGEEATGGIAAAPPSTCTGHLNCPPGVLPPDPRCVFTCAGTCAVGSCGLACFSKPDGGWSCSCECIRID